jgi:hypothetical protein
MGAGFGAGVGATVWTEVKLRRTAQRFTPGAIGEGVAGRARVVRHELREALREGREAMLDREAELRGSSAMPPLRSTPQLVGGAAPVPAALVGRALVELPGAKIHSRHPRTREAGPSPAVRWVDHGHERRSARFS